MPIAHVMPCLNEAALLEATATSLGFGEAASPAAGDVFLVLVDNGSTDGTREVMERVASASRPGSVLIIEESERGFVPPRRRGALHVQELATRVGEPPDRWLILQADADTQYLPGYAQWMQQYLGEQTGVLLEGAVRRDAAFDAAYPAYRAFEREVDCALDGAPVIDEQEIIVDDKTCGYVLADYLTWGGHFREFDAEGSEVHAETARLFLRARLAHQAIKIRVNPAQAIPSRRRILEDPALHFATAGFPRETGWLRRWRERHPSCRTISEFMSDLGDSEVREALFFRRAHNIALFWLLPWLVQRAVDGPLFTAPDERTSDLLRLVPNYAANELAAAPSLAVMCVLGAIQRQPHAFDV